MRILLRRIRTAIRLISHYGVTWTLRFALRKTSILSLKRFSSNKFHLNRQKKFNIENLKRTVSSKWRDENKPYFSIIVPTYNTQEDYLLELLASVNNQTYPYWELLIQDDCSNSLETIEFLNRLRGITWNVRYARNLTNLGISATSNIGALKSTGDWLLFLDHDDLLHADSLMLLAEEIQKGDVDYLYSDEDKITPFGEHYDVTYKPNWSPETLLDHMYILHPVVIRKSEFLRIGMFRSEFSGAQDYDLVLRASENNLKIKHIPFVLYHWRATPESSAENVTAKSWALPLARQALLEHVSSKYSKNAQILPGYLEGHFRVRFNPKEWPSVSILIPTDARLNPRTGNLLLESLLNSLHLDYYKGKLEVIVADNYNLPLPFVESIHDRRISFLHYESSSSFNFSNKLNFIASHANGEILIILNDDMEIITNDWISSLVEWAQLPEIGCVGSKLVYPDGKIQHAGVSYSQVYGVVHNFYKADLPLLPGEFWINVFRNSDMVTGAGMAIRSSIFKEVGGFDEQFAIDFNDVDFCLRVTQTGRRNIYNPYSTILHFEGATVLRDQPNKAELEAFKARWSVYAQNYSINSIFWR